MHGQVTIHRTRWGDEDDLERARQIKRLSQAGVPTLLLGMVSPFALRLAVAVLADQKVIAVDTIDRLLQLDHPWIQEYFNGPRGRAAAAA